VTDPTKRLVDILVPVSGHSAAQSISLPPLVDNEYREFLAACNGGYTPDSFYHFFGSSGPAWHDVVDWNRPERWKESFGIVDDIFVFAEDIFGNQYGFRKLGKGTDIRMISSFSGDISRAPSPFAAFVEYLVFDKEVNPQAVLANEFLTRINQSFHGKHISYDVHPYLGGDQNDITNFDLIDSGVNLNWNGQLATQIRKLPPGTRLKSVRMDPSGKRVELEFEE